MIDFPKGFKASNSVLTQQDINGGFTHIIMNIEDFVNFLLHTLNNVQTVAVERSDEWFQYVLMESWCD